MLCHKHLRFPCDLEAEVRVMSAVLEKVERDAMSLPDQQRAFLADRLLSSVEAERRYGEYKSGKRQPISASQVFDQADRILG